MADNRKLKRNLNPNVFKKYLSENDYSIRKLGKESDIHERTLRRSVKSEKISVRNAMILCDFFDENCNVLFGQDNSDEWQRVQRYLV